MTEAILNGLDNLLTEYGPQDTELVKQISMAGIRVLEPASGNQAPSAVLDSKNDIVVLVDPKIQREIVETELDDDYEGYDAKIILVKSEIERLSPKLKGQFDLVLITAPTRELATSIANDSLPFVKPEGILAVVLDTTSTKYEDEGSIANQVINSAAIEPLGKPRRVSAQTAGELIEEETEIPVVLKSELIIGPSTPVELLMFRQSKADD